MYKGCCTFAHQTHILEQILLYKHGSSNLTPVGLPNGNHFNSWISVWTLRIWTSTLIFPGYTMNMKELWNKFPHVKGVKGVSNRLNLILKDKLNFTDHFIVAIHTCLMFHNKNIAKGKPIVYKLLPHCTYFGWLPSNICLFLFVLEINAIVASIRPAISWKKLFLFKE